VVLGDRLEIGVLDDHELTLRDLPALHDLVRADLTLVGRAPALLADRGLALAVKRAEAHVRLLRLGRGRESQANGDVDQAEGNGSVPDCAHGAAPENSSWIGPIRRLAEGVLLGRLVDLAVAEGLADRGAHRQRGALEDV